MFSVHLISVILQLNIICGAITAGDSFNHIHSNSNSLLLSRNNNSSSSSRLLSTQESNGPEKVLVIGAAGFIGFHLMERLLNHRNSLQLVTGMDNFNVDHSVRLKRQRAEYLEARYNLRIRSSNRDMCNTQKISARLAEEKYTHVILLAPPAASLDLNSNSNSRSSSNSGIDVVNRNEHVSNAAKCFDQLLDAIASSSSTSSSSGSLRRSSGIHSNSNSAKHNNVDMPKLIYLLPQPAHTASEPLAQTRIWELQMRTALTAVAQQRFKKHGLIAVGLYFDVVYGPWDNPDSEISSWVDTIYKNRPVEVNTELLLRSRRYSFVEDAVKGIVRVLDYATAVATKPAVLDMSEATAELVADTLSIFRSLEFSSKKNMSLLLNSQQQQNVYLRHIESTADDASVLPASTALSSSSSSHRSSSHSSSSGSSSNNISSDNGSSSSGINSFGTIASSSLVPLQKGIERFVEWFRHFESRIFPCASECVGSSGSSYSSGGRSNEELCFASAWDRVATLTRQITAGCVNVYYTVAIDSTVNGLHPLQKFESDPQLRCNIAFVSRNSPFVTGNDTNTYSPEQIITLEKYSYQNWTIVLLDDFNTAAATTSSSSSAINAAAVFSDPRKPTRVPKLSPSRFFAASARYAVYMDSKLRLTCDPREYVLMMDADFPENQRKGPLALLAVRISEHEDGIFYHIDHVLKRTAERPSITFYDQVLRQQKRAYHEFEDRLSVKFINIFDGAFMIHDLKSEVGKEFRCEWYREYQQWSDRDQVAVSYILTRRAKSMRSRAAVKRREFIPIGKEQRPGFTAAAAVMTNTVDVLDALRLLSSAGYNNNSSSSANSMLTTTATATAATATAAAVVRLQKTANSAFPDYYDSQPLLTNFNNTAMPKDKTTTTTTTTTTTAVNSLSSSSNNNNRQLRYSRDSYAERGIHYVRLLPRLKYHWTYHSQLIGRLEFFDWNRVDDERYKNMASYLLEMERKRLMKQCVKYGSLILLLVLLGVVGYRSCKQICNRGTRKRVVDP